MKGYNGWSYAPYRPFLFEVGDIYICRVAPSATQIHLEWLGGAEEYTVYVRRRGEASFVAAGTVLGCEYDITDLEDGTDYEFYVTLGDKKSRVRLARTGAAVGTVVNYLHPEDPVYSFSGHSLCSPSLVKYPDGTLLASMDVYKGEAPQNFSLIFRSDDEGRTWNYVSELMPCFWGKMFLHKDELYMLACSTEYGDLLIGKSVDKGRTFTTPTVLLRGTNGSHGNGIHKNPQNIMYYGGRIYETLEWGRWEGEYQHAAMVMSCDENADLLVAENWHFTPPVKYDPTWPGVAKGPARGTIEGTLCVNPEGELVNIMRYQTTPECDPPYGLVLCYKVNTQDPDAPLEYSHAISFPGNLTKFMIKKDDISGRYYSIMSRILGADVPRRRNLLSLMVSDDLENWRLGTDLLDYRDTDPLKVGFQYVDFYFDGDDIIYLCRTAMNGAWNYHDANYSTYHVVKDFRQY
ncbi:MAG: hypothetical protein IJ315_07365 [Firmicutes bacterium]|nr:hypothetical protein [Bacillota bacterium]